MDKELIKKKKEELEIKFNKIKNQVAELERNVLMGKEELVRLQGEFRLLNELEKESEKGQEIKENKK